MDIENAKQELTRTLLEAVGSIVSAAIELGLSMDLPTYACDVVWLEDFGGRGEERRRRWVKLDRFGVGRLFDQLTTNAVTLDPIRKLEKTLESMVTIWSCPPDILPLNRRGDLAKYLTIIYLETTKSLSVVPAIAARVSEQFVTDLASPTYGAISVYLVNFLEAPGAFDIDANVHFRPISDGDYEEYSTVEPGGWLGFDRPWLFPYYHFCNLG